MLSLTWLTEQSPQNLGLKLRWIPFWSKNARWILIGSKYCLENSGCTFLSADPNLSSAWWGVFPFALKHSCKMTWTSSSVAFLETKWKRFFDIFIKNLVRQKALIQRSRYSNRFPSQFPCKLFASLQLSISDLSRSFPFAEWPRLSPNLPPYTRSCPLILVSACWKTAFRLTNVFGQNPEHVSRTVAHYFENFCRNRFLPHWFHILVWLILPQFDRFGSCVNRGFFSRRIEICTLRSCREG